MNQRYVNSVLVARLGVTTAVAGAATASIGAVLVETAPIAAAGVGLAAAGLSGALAYLAARRAVRGETVVAEKLLDANIDMLEAIGGAIAKRESGPGAHNSRLVYYALRLGAALKLSPSEMRVLAKGAFVHDVGNVVLPDAILLKQSRLDEVEFEAIKTHCYHGADIVSHSPWLAEAVDIVRNHHERWDGTGYPSGLKGDAIPLTARAFAVADVFDALTSERPYRAPLSFDKAMEILQIGRGGHFDPVVVDVFASMAASLYDQAESKPQTALESELREVALSLFRSAP